MLSSVYLAAEDSPGLAVGRKLITEAHPLTVYREENARGYGKLKAKARNYHQMGVRMPVLMLTDLDENECPSEIIKEWIGDAPSVGFLFRVCVREIEAWLIADRERLAEYFGISPAKISSSPESLDDPKAELIRLSQLSRQRAIRAAFMPHQSAPIGPGYNEYLERFIINDWRPDVATSFAPSLAKARLRIRELAAIIE